MLFPAVPSSHSLASHRTMLPMASVGESVQVAPQYNPVTWAMYTGRTRLYMEASTATLVLVAYAQHASAALFSPEGYSATTPSQVASLLDVSISTVRRWTKECVRRGLLVQHGDGYRLPEVALDGSWTRA